MDGSICISAGFVIFPKLFHCICLFGCKLFASQASLCRSQILPEALWRFGRAFQGLDFLHVHLGWKKKWDELAPAGSGLKIICVLPTWFTIWCPCELHSCKSVKMRGFCMVGEYIFKGHNLVFDFCPSFLQSCIPISFECLWKTSLLNGVTLSVSFYPKIW